MRFRWHTSDVGRLVKPSSRSDLGMGRDRASRCGRSARLHSRWPAFMEGEMGCGAKEA